MQKHFYICATLSTNGLPAEKVSKAISTTY